MLKQFRDDLAIFGGVPTFSDPLHVNRPHVGDLEPLHARLKTIWDARWFTNDGPFVRELEERLAEYLQVDHCVATNSGTAAMSLLVHALQLGGEVIMPSFTFISTAHVLTWADINPVFCDIDTNTHNINLEHCERLITPITSAIIPTHVWGNVCDVDALRALCASRRIPLLFDAAHAFGRTQNGTSIAGCGTADVFSFHATKVFHTFEGGAITTNNANLADKLRRMRNFGFSDYDQVNMVGTNAKMSEVHAAMGLVNLEAIAQTLSRSAATYETYRVELADVPGLAFPDTAPAKRTNHQYVPILVDADTFGLSRDALLQILHAEGVLARRYFYPGCHAAAPYKARCPEPESELPETLEVCRQILVLPSGAEVSEDDARRVCAILRFVAANAATVSEWMERVDQYDGAAESNG